jgi:hypothetical protein
MLEILSFPVFFLIICSFYAVCCLGLNIQYGFTGLFNVGIAGFFGVGAYTSAILSGPRYPDTLIGGFELPIILSWLAAIVISAFSGLLVGFITLRLREDFLAISTFGIAITLQLIALNLESFTRGPNGLYGLPKPLSDWSEDPVVDNILFLLIAFAVIAVPRKDLQIPLGKSLAFNPGRRIRSRGDGEECLQLQTPGVCAWMCHHGAFRGDVRQFHAVHQPPGFYAHLHHPGLCDADCRRKRQQSRSDPGSIGDLGALVCE